jgi:hypothetical protein
MHFRSRANGHRPHLRIVATPQAASDETETEDLPRTPPPYGWRVTAKILLLGAGVVSLALAFGYVALLGWFELHGGSW